MNLNKTLVELRKITEKWGFSMNDWALTLHSSDLIQGYDLKYWRDKHLHIIISEKSIPWPIDEKGKAEEIPVPNDDFYGKSFAEFIKITGYDFHIVICKPKLFKELIDKYSILHDLDKNNMIRLITTEGNLIFQTRTMGGWKKIYSDDVILRRMKIYELMREAAIKKSDKKIINLCNYILDNFKPKEKKFSDEEKKALDYYNKNRTIKGQVGQEGKTKGKVLLIDNPDLPPHPKTGYVLVSKLTSPKLVPNIKKSLAVITDEGGRLSHAAIVCREFKIPCITGTKIATKVLKNDDIIEVNAKGGLIKKII